MLHYHDGSRSFPIKITRHLSGTRQYFTYRILDGTPDRGQSEPYLFYLDCLRAALDAARRLSRKASH